MAKTIRTKRRLDSDIDFQIERASGERKYGYMCKRKTKQRYKRNKENIRKKRVGNYIIKWVLTKSSRRW